MPCHDFVPCVPRDPFETAGSIADALLGRARRARRAGRICLPGMAYGTLSWSLAALATCTADYYGSAEHLLETRTLVDFCGFQLRPIWRTAMRHHALTGEGVYRTPAWIRWMIGQLGQPLTCPVCRAEAWKAYGTACAFWPHRLPFVTACWRHAIVLTPEYPLQNAPRDGKLVKAMAAQVDFAVNAMIAVELA
jgi:hypothetical protein